VKNQLKIDLHLHTTRSDGHLTPTELVRLLVSRGISIAAITDHDSTEGLDEAFAEASHYPELRLIPGIEMSADLPDGTGDVHLLGYFLNYHDRNFQEHLLRFREGRVNGAKLMVDKLRELGLPVDWERVRSIADGASVGRPHIAQAMVERGYINSQKDAFKEYLQDGGKAHIARPHILVADAVSLIKSVGGVAVLAHPLYLSNYPDLIANLTKIGVVGLEVHYAEFTPTQRSKLIRLANQYNLLPCGGSDYHAFGSPNEHLPGTAGPPLEVFQKLEDLSAPVRKED
jgi:predicted metal-dependent phosphoesterase TrpH